jgi:hypothetical protein
MLRRSALLSTVALLLLAAAAPAHAAPMPPLSTVSSTTETQTIVTRLDPLTLEPIGPSVQLDEFHGGWSYSPDRTEVAFGKSPAGSNSRGGIHIVDVDPIRLDRIVDTDIFVGALAWLAPDRIVGLAGGEAPFAVDPLAAQPAPQALSGRGPGCPGGGPYVRTRNALVWLSARGVRTINGAGRVGAASLRPLRAVCQRAGLGAEPGGRRVWVLDAGNRAVSVDLPSMRPTVHRLADAGPRAADYTQVVPLGGGVLAVAYADSHARPHGAQLVDTRTGRRRTLAPRAGEVRLVGGTLLTLDGGGTLNGVRAPSRNGLQGFTRNGRRRFSLLRGQRVWDVQVSGRYAWAIATNGVTVVDVRRGKALSHSPRRLRDGVVFLNP